MYARVHMHVRMCMYEHIYVPYVHAHIRMHVCVCNSHVASLAPPFSPPHCTKTPSVWAAPHLPVDQGLPLGTADFGSDHGLGLSGHCGVLSGTLAPPAVTALMSSRALVEDVL